MATRPRRRNRATRPAAECAGSGAKASARAERDAADESKVRINPQGDIEIQKRGSWIVIGGLLGDYATRIRKLTGLDWN